MMKSRFCIIIRSLRKARGKLGNVRGVSFAEMLLCVLILALSTGVTVSTLDLGITHFKARTRETEQRLLCNTLSLAVQEYLTYANKIEWDDSTSPPTLTKFRTGANNALESRVCKFVTQYYEDNQLVTTDMIEAKPGQIALEYLVDTNRRYYALADKSQYIVKRTAPNDVKLAATLDVKVDRVNKRFKVTIAVKSEDVAIKPATNDFIVIPIHSGVFN